MSEDAMLHLRAGSDSLLRNKIASRRNSSTAKKFFSLYRMAQPLLLSLVTGNVAIGRAKALIV
jgi:hypothetical protein